MRPIHRRADACHRCRAQRSAARWSLGLGALLVALGARGSARAAPTVTVELASFAELDAGKPEGTAVSSRGEVVAGLGQRRLAKLPPATLVWSAVRAADPRTLFLGTGDEARLWAVEGEQVRVVAQLDGLVITALTRGPRGKLLAATMPGARLLEVDPTNGKWRQLAALPAKHIWALYWDAARDRVVAASGAPGKLFSVALSGAAKPAVLFDPKEQHLLCLVPDAAGRLLTGSHDRAVLYRVSPNGRGEALHDFQASEVHAVAVGREGAIFIAVNQFPPESSGVPRFDVVAKGAGGTPLPGKAASSAPATPKPRAEELRPGAKAAKGALYRLDAQGRLDELLALPSGYFTELAIDRQGTLWAGEGSEGKVYRVGAQRAVQAVFDLPERQVRVLAVDAEPPYLATADGAAVYRVLPAPAQAPTYLSKVVDAGLVAQWGELYFQATAPLELFSRSGNTATPDDLWSGWQAAKSLATGRVRLLSPYARYLQLKAVWRKPYAGHLRSLKVYYRPTNQRARVTEIVATQGEGVEGAERREARIKLRWQVENPDKDPLVYWVYFRPELGKVWRPIDRQLPLDKAEYVWETESIADGSYRLRVVASDEAANGPEQTLRHALISRPVLVDNRPPEIATLSVREANVEGTARDAASPIRELAYALDGERWRLLEPVDGVFDAQQEAFRLRLPPRLAPGPHTLALRARDEAGNVAVRQLEFHRGP
ncbi:MAG: hypothetical protein IPL40_06210 [Proteobacteria bacterium]|nr:hypothetical protein [Pseudomonadota bacterium]